MIELKDVYKGINEVKFYDKFKEAIPGLLTDFINANPNFHNYGSTDNLNVISNTLMTPLVTSTNGWKIQPIKSLSSTLANNNQNLNNIYSIEHIESVIKTKHLYPTAHKLVESFGDQCDMATYSVFEPNTILYRHTGMENRDAKNIRIHIPLYIPKGDIGFEVQGQEVYWDDIFSFNNQKLHSVWNNTNERRLIFIIDLRRHICDLPPAPPWSEEENKKVPVFEKTRNPKYIG